MEHQSNLAFLVPGIVLTSVAGIGLLAKGEFPGRPLRPPHKRSEEPFGYWIRVGALIALSGLFWIALFRELSRG